METLREHLQILKTIVRSVSVLVMNDVPVWDRSVRGYPDQAMFQRVLPSPSPDRDISLRIGVAPTFPTGMFRRFIAKFCAARAALWNVPSAAGGRVAFDWRTALLTPMREIGNHGNTIIPDVMAIS